MTNIDDFRKSGCIFCEKPSDVNDEDTLVVYRGRTCFMIMNAFPYNTGHLMIAPFRHVGTLEALERDEHCELMELAVLAAKAVTAEMKSQGMNLGINVGKAAGAGIEDHLHMHLVPRWEGDTNFMPVVADVKVMPESLQDTHARLKRAIEDLASGEAQGQ